MIEELINKYECISDENLINYNTYRLDTKCRLIIFPKDIDELKDIINIIDGNIKYFVIGNGSNIILPKYYDGIIIKLKYFNNYNVFNNILSVDSGVMINKLSIELSRIGFKGLEWANGIPGTIGGCIYNNAGCYNEEIANHIISVTVLNKNKIYDMDLSKLNFSYRDSIFKSNKDIIILSAKFKLEKEDSDVLLNLINERTNKRIMSQPLNYPSCGSVFRNPDGLVAGKLIDESNLKGYKIGGAEVSNKHANFIINSGNATSEDIINLINVVKDTIKKNYNIDLVLEQEIIK